MKMYFVLIHINISRFLPVFRNSDGLIKDNVKETYGMVPAPFLELDLFRIFLEIYNISKRAYLDIILMSHNISAKVGIFFQKYFQERLHCVINTSDSSLMWFT